MKIRTMVVAMAAVFAMTLTGCATSRQMEKVEADQKLLDAKVEQALQNAQVAKTAADEAKQKAADATNRAEQAEKAAQERERLANEKMQRADAAFQKSMRK